MRVVFRIIYNYLYLRRIFPNLVLWEQVLWFSIVPKYKDKEVKRMKNRKSLMSLAIVVLVLLLGVGYAIVNETELTIGGTASAKETNINVHFTGEVQKNDEAENGKIDEASHDDEITAVLNVSDLTYEEEVSAVYTIINDEKDLTANLSEKSISVMSKPTDGSEAVSLKDYFNVSLELGATSLAPGKTTTATVTVKLAKSPVESIQSVADIEVVILAEVAE